MIILNKHLMKGQIRIMDCEKINKFKQLLIEEMDRFERNIEHMKDNGVSEADVYSPTELSNYDNHPADLGTDLFQLEMNNTLKQHQQNMKISVEEALDRIDKGVYGKCLDCEKEIPEERLLVRPDAKFCIECADELVPNKVFDDLGDTI